MSTLDQFTNPFGLPESDVQVEESLLSRVILFNDDWHTFDEVIEQIILATGCSHSHAERCTLEVHHLGKSMVYEGDISACLRASAILEEIALHTQLVM